MAATTSNELSHARAALLRERDAKLAEAANIERALQQLEQVMESLVPGSVTGQTRTDRYAGLSISEAARKYLQMPGTSPATTREICTALTAGGYKTTARNWYMTVYASLRDTKGFVRTEDGRWHLEEDVVAPVPEHQPIPAATPKGRRRR